MPSTVGFVIPVCCDVESRWNRNRAFVNAIDNIPRIGAKRSGQPDQRNLNQGNAHHPESALFLSTNHVATVVILAVFIEPKDRYLNH